MTQKETTYTLLENKATAKKKQLTRSFSLLDNGPLDETTLNKIHSSKQEWMVNFSRHLNYKIASQYQISRLEVLPNWVFGINISSITKSFCYYNE